MPAFKIFGMESIKTNIFCGCMIETRANFFYFLILDLASVFPF